MRWITKMGLSARSLPLLARHPVAPGSRAFHSGFSLGPVGPPPVPWLCPPPPPPLLQRAGNFRSGSRCAGGGAAGYSLTVRAGVNGSNLHVAEVCRSLPNEIEHHPDPEGFTGDDVRLTVNRGGGSFFTTSQVLINDPLHIQDRGTVRHCLSSCSYLCVYLGNHSH
jgi:hypothetical protein